MQTVYCLTTTAIRIRGLADAVTGATIADATVTATLTDAGTVVEGAENLACPPVAGKAGDYAGKIPATVALTPGRRYVLMVTIDGGADRAKTVRIPARAEYAGA